jgi:hypothetical protein
VSSLAQLSKGHDNPVKLNNISIYTSLPGDNNKDYDMLKLIETAKMKSSVVLIDCDFNSSIEAFKLCQNIYVVQDMDILNLQPITVFLREIKYKGINLEKVKIIINKYIKCGVPVKRLIEGLSTYINPEMTLYDEVLEKGLNYYILPFNELNYKKYVEGLYVCTVDYKAFTEDFKQAMDILTNSIFPLSSARFSQNSLAVALGSIKDVFSFKNIFSKKKKIGTQKDSFEKVNM